MPIYKQKGSLLLPVSYRPIRLLQTVGKIFVECLRRVALVPLHRHISQLQGAFRKRRATVHQVFAMLGLIRMRARRRLPTYVIFIDQSKAYDRVFRPGLWAELDRLGMPARFQRMFHELYRHDGTRVVCPQGTSRSFFAQLGLRQGCKASPSLYNLATNSLLVSLEESGIGVRIVRRLRRNNNHHHNNNNNHGVNYATPGFMYADDLALIAENPADAQRLLDIVSEWGRRWRASFNTGPGKTEAVVFGAQHVPEPDRNPEFFIDVAGRPERIRIVDGYKYLGVRLDADLSWSAFNANLRATAIRKLAWLNGNASRRHGVTLPPRFVSRLWLQVARPALEYASGCCADNVPQSLVGLQRWAAKRTLGASTTALSAAALGDLGWSSMQIRREHALLRSWGELLAMPEEQPARYVYDALVREDRRRSWTGKVEAIARRWGFGDVWDNQALPPRPSGLPDADGVYWRRSLRDLAKERACDQWQEDVDGAIPFSSIARDYSIWMHVRRGAPAMQMAEYVAEARTCDEGARLLFAIRSGTSDLHGDRGRRTRTPRHLRTCAFCETRSFEGVHHVVSNCPAHAEARRALTACLPPAINDLSDADVVDALMGASSLHELVPDDVRRIAAVDAFKRFLVMVFQRRETLADAAATT